MLEIGQITSASINSENNKSIHSYTVVVIDRLVRLDTSKVSALQSICSNKIHCVFETIV